MTFRYLLIGSISGLMAVSLGAFGAHGLKGQLSERLFNVWVTGTEYQFYHSLALDSCGVDQPALSGFPLPPLECQPVYSWPDSVFR